MPPLHPMLVHFPIALFTLALGADLFGRARGSADARTLGFWCLILAAAGAAVAAGAGFIDMSRADLAEATHRFVHLHRDLGVFLLASLLLLALWRWRIRRRMAAAGVGVGGPYLVAAGAVFSLLVFQAWFGGELVYGLGAGVAAAGQGVVSPEEGQTGLAPFAVFTEPAHAHHGSSH